MSENVPAAVFELARARSELIDTFARAEAAVRTRLISVELQPKQVLSQSTDLLGKQPASPKYSKKEKAVVEAALARLKGMQTIRCDLVHGIMQWVKFDGHEQACFINVQGVSRLGCPARLMTVENMQAASADLRDLIGTIAPVKPQLL